MADGETTREATPAADRSRGWSRRMGLPVAVFAVAGGVLFVLLALANRYGFHCDELYFVLAGRHPDFGYLDQPPLDPLLSAAMVQLFGLSPLAVRILPALCAAGCVILTAAMARQFGASPRGQVVAAVVVAGSGLLGLGHLGVTATYDVFFWTVILWLLSGILARPERPARAAPRWVALGLVAGLALENKALPLALAATLGAGLVLTRRWDVLRSRWTWRALLIAFAIWIPNLVWQAGHGFSQLTMAASVSDLSSDGDGRLKMIGELLLLAGPFTVPVALAGTGWLLLSADARRWRPLGWVVALTVGLMAFAGGRAYYAGGVVPLAVAAGAGPLDRWLRGSLSLLRSSGAVAGYVASAALVAVLTLPIVPAESLRDTPIPSYANGVLLQVGWDRLANAVRSAADELTPEQRAGAVIVTRDYAEGSALAILGPDLPPVYSGHNSMGDWGPPASSTAVILVDMRDEGRGAGFLGCRPPFNGYAGPIEGLGAFEYYWSNRIEICDAPALPWPDQWPTLRHVDVS